MHKNKSRGGGERAYIRMAYYQMFTGRWAFNWIWWVGAGGGGGLQVAVYSKKEPKGGLCCLNSSI